MELFSLDRSDEFPHPAIDSPMFNESVYVNGFDPQRRFGGWMRLGNRVNEGYAELSVCLYRQTEELPASFRGRRFRTTKNSPPVALLFESSSPSGKLTSTMSARLWFSTIPSN